MMCGQQTFKVNLGLSKVITIFPVCKLLEKDVIADSSCEISYVVVGSMGPIVPSHKRPSSSFINLLLVVSHLSPYQATGKGKKLYLLIIAGF